MNPVSSVQDQVASWKLQWGGTYNECCAYFKAVQDIRELALKVQFSREYWEKLINVHSVRHAAKTLRANTCSELFPTSALSYLPNFVLQELVELMLFIVKTVALPSACFQVYLFLLP